MRKHKQSNNAYLHEILAINISALKGSIWVVIFGCLALFFAYLLQIFWSIFEFTGYRPAKDPVMVILSILELNSLIAYVSIAVIAGSFSVISNIILIKLDINFSILNKLIKSITPSLKDAISIVMTMLYILIISSLIYTFIKINNSNSISVFIIILVILIIINFSTIPILLFFRDIEYKKITTIKLVTLPIALLFLTAIILSMGT